MVIAKMDFHLLGRQDDNRVCMSRFIKSHGPALFWAILIFILSSIPSLKTPDVGLSWQDKGAHVLEFGIFGFFLQRSFRTFFNEGIRVHVFVLIVGVLYGGLDELHQLFVEGRQASVEDFLADSIGIFLSQVFCWIGKRNYYF